MKGTLSRTLSRGLLTRLNSNLHRVVRKRARVLAMLVVLSLLLFSLPPAGRTQQVGGTSYPAEGMSLRAQLVQTVSLSLSAVGSWLARLAGSASPESAAAPPVAAFISPAPPFIDAPTNLTVTATSATSVSLSWTAPAGGVDHYQIERSQNVEGPFFFLANVTGATTHNDNTVTNQQAYLYRVRAVTTAGLPSAPSNMALGTAIAFQFSNLQGQLIKAQHFHDLRTAINLVRGLGNLAAATWTRSNLTGLATLASDVNEMRTALDQGLTALGIPVTAYTDPTLQAGVTVIKAVHLEQLQLRSTRGSSNSSGPIDSDSSLARLDPLNETGGSAENALSRNFNWTLSLLSLTGRADLNLGLNLSYNSLVWTKSGNVISFDDDNGFPGPGFRLGFPVIQQIYFNTEVGKQAYLLLNPDGSRTELRQVGSSTLYESADSSYLLLDAFTMVLKTKNGMQLSYVLNGGEFTCTKIKDRNGNFITISYTGAGRIDTVTDTLARNIKFNYDANGRLTSITQIWNQGQPSQVTHNWARFEYADVSIDYNFTGLTAVGLADNSPRNMLSRVKLADDSYFDFSYTSWGQIWKIGNFSPNGSPLNYRSYNLPQTGATAHNDCPRFTSRKDWARYWNGDTDGTTASNEEAETTFIVPVSDAWTMPDGSQQTGIRTETTTPDGTINKIYFIGAAGTSTGWRRGLPALVETHSGGTWQRKTVTSWTQDNTALPYELNPRLTETNAYDPAGNRARQVMTYQQFTFANGTSCHLPRDLYEYAANASTILRSTRTDYNTSATYSDRRILGLVSERRLYEGDVNNGGVLKSRVAYNYDETGSIQGTDAPVQHDNENYSWNFVAGRGNLSSVRRHDVTSSAFTAVSSKYNTAGAVVSSKDASDHETVISYADSFSDNNNSRNTLAYATTITDPDVYSSTSKYQFDFGGVTSTRTPQPNSTTNTLGPEVTYTFDAIGRPDEITNVANGATIRFVYTINESRVDTYREIQAGQSEARSFAIVDGHGRTVATASEFPGSVGGFTGRKMIFDVMGRVFKASNPTETSASGAPANWVAAGDDAAAGWIYTQQTYDWKSRPLITTNTDGTTKSVSYSSCGCAGSDVVTITDEGTINGGVLKRRQAKSYSDVLGRVVKKEVLNWEGGSVYSTTVNTYDVRDSLTQIRDYAGAEGSATFQDTTMTYDGFGRLQSRHVPEQAAAKSTAWTYNPDDTINSITDARDASKTFTYNGRHLPTGITYAAPSGISVPANVTYSYDAAGNRTAMNDGHGAHTYQYDQLSRISQESRQLSIGTFNIAYTYNLTGQLMSVTDHFNDSISYTRNVQGQLKTITGSPYVGLTNYINNVDYRAWGAPKSISYAGSTATISYNSRLLASQYRLINQFGSSVISENYSYYADGQVAALQDLDDTGGTNPPATLRFLSRTWSYDHLSRVIDSHGTGAGSMPGVPYAQGYGYDAFGHVTSRTGSYYNYTFQQPTTDSSTYTNNRRSNWTYDAEGQVLSTPLTSTDRPRTMTYDADRRMVTSVETGQFSTTTYSASYDGDGRVVFESSVTSPGTSDSAYIIHSTVLNGEAFMRVSSSGQKRVTNVHAEGLLFASQKADSTGPFNSTVVRSPLGVTEAGRAVYDPLGNFIPFQAHGDPRPPAGSYSSASMQGLSNSQKDPFSLAVGCVLDGVPTNCDRVMRLVNNDSAEIDPFSSISRVGNGIWLEMGLTMEKKYGFLEDEFGNVSREIGEYWGYRFLKNLAPGGQPTFQHNPHTHSPRKLTDCLKDVLAPYFPGLDLDKINIHTDGIPEIVESFNTVKNGPGAVTWGNDIYYPAKTYDPTSNRAIAKLAHEIVHVWQYSVLGKVGFSKQYAIGYARNIQKQLQDNLAKRTPDQQRIMDMKIPPYLFDITGMFRYIKSLQDKIRDAEANVDLNKAYEEIPLEKQAYDFEADFLRYLDEVSEASGKKSVCP